MALYADGKGKYQKHYEQLCNKLVPNGRKCETVHCELLRSIRALADEYYRNGNINWDNEYESLVDLIRVHLLQGMENSTSPNRREQLASDLDSILENARSGNCPYSDSEDEYDRVINCVVEWCQM
jgi:hypothetical protein